MKLKRLMTASMAAVMAVSSAIVCQISVSAAETDITSQITSGISVSELSQYTSLKVTYKPTPTADGKCGHTHAAGVSYCEYAQVPFIANSVEGIDADISNSKKSTWYQPDSAFTAKSGKDEKETTAEVDVADIINSFTSDKDWKDTFTLKSVTVQCWGGTLSKVVGVTGSEDTRTRRQNTRLRRFSHHDDQAGGAVMVPQRHGSGHDSGYYRRYNHRHHDLRRDQGQVQEHHFQRHRLCEGQRWRFRRRLHLLPVRTVGQRLELDGFRRRSLDSKTKWSVTGIAEKFHADQVKQGSDATINDTDVLQVIGIQINMADTNNLPAGVAALKAGETFTINSAGAAVESVKITQKNGATLIPNTPMAKR